MRLILEPQDFISAIEASTYDKLLEQYPLQRNRFLVRVSVYYYMSLLFPVKAIRAFKATYDQISNILKHSFPTDYNDFINSKTISISASAFIYTETNIALIELFQIRPLFHLFQNHRYWMTKFHV